MKRFLVIIASVLTVSSLARGQVRRSSVQEELLKWEKEFTQAIVANDVDAIGRFLADEWIIIDPDGGVIDRTRFLGVIKSGVLTHEAMESEDTSVRLYGDTAVVTGLTRTRGKYSGQAFTSRERATDVLVKQDGRWRCVFSQLTRSAGK